MFMIRRGHVAARVVTEHGDEMTLVVLGPGDTFGELALIGARHSRGATVVTLDAVDTWMLSRSQLTTLRADRPGMDQILIDLPTRQVDLLTGQLLEALYVPVRHHVVRALLRLCARYDTEQPARASTRAPELSSPQESWRCAAAG